MLHQQEELMKESVVREIDVYLTDDIQLYLTQFPMRPVYQEPPQVKSARFKPKCNKMELSIPYPPGMQRSSDSTQNDRMQRFVSTEVKLNENLGAGFIYEDRMIISPIQTVLQFRPGLNPGSGASSVVAVEALGKEKDDDNLQAANESVQQIQLKRKESERAQAMRLKSYAYLKQQADQEQWQDMIVFPIGSHDSENKFTDMYHSTFHYRDDGDSS